MNFDINAYKRDKIISAVVAPFEAAFPVKWVYARQHRQTFPHPPGSFWYMIAPTPDEAFEIEATEWVAPGFYGLALLGHDQTFSGNPWGAMVIFDVNSRGKLGTLLFPEPAQVDFAGATMELPDPPILIRGSWWDHAP